MVKQVFDQFLRRIPVRRRIIGGFMLIMFLAGIISPILLTNFNTLVTRLEQFTRVDANIERMLLLASRRVAVSQLNLNRYIQDYVPSPYEALDDVNQAIQGLNDAKTLAIDPEQTKSITLVIQALKDYQQQITDLQKARTAGNNDETTRLESKLQKLGNDIGLRLELMVNSNVKLVAATNQEVLDDAQNSIGLGFLLMAIGFILAITLSVLTSLSITRPLAELRAGTEAFQKGNMTSIINAAGADEFTVIAQIFNSLTKQINELISTLENRVVERTVDLEIANERNQKRAVQFETVAQVARSTSSILDIDELLPFITQLISQKFGFYHTGIFLLDDAREYAVLKAANTEGGKRMLAREHKLKVGQIGIVGYVTGTGKPRVALDTGEDAVFFDNPDLPNTHSEMALPLSVAGQLLGALDVQSEKANAFGQEDIVVLSTLADQVSVAIQNARTFHDAQKLLAEARSATSGYVSEAWKTLRPASMGTGYQKAGLSVKPLEKPLEGEHIRLATESGKTVTRPSTLTVPIRLRGQIIGVMNLQVAQGRAWNPEEVDIAEAVAERLSLVMETSTLLKATQRRADIERITADISGKISSSTRFETILQTAAQELSRALGGSDVLVQIEPIAMKINPSI